MVAKFFNVIFSCSFFINWKEHNFISELDEIEAIGFRIPYAGFKFLSPVFYSPEVRESIVTYA